MKQRKHFNILGNNIFVPFKTESPQRTAKVLSNF